MTESSTTHFGYEQVPVADKMHSVGRVFSSVAADYDIMNDIMSMGIHRLWKRHAVHLCAIRPDYQVLDLAGGTGDIATLVAARLGNEGNVILCDINAEMLHHGRDRLVDKGILKGIHYVQGNAEQLPFQQNSFDCITIAFGLRNVTDKEKALRSMYDKLKYGSQLVILEFSTVIMSFIDWLYEKYSFKLIPMFGKLVANDEASYKYLVESIRMHPDQETLSDMMRGADFIDVQYHNLSGGIVAIHRGYK